MASNTRIVMTIETKYNIGDEVWCLYCRIKNFTIVGVRVTTKDVQKFCIKRFTETVIEYLIDGEWVEEHPKFEMVNKEEFIEKTISYFTPILKTYCSEECVKELIGGFVNSLEE